MRPDDLLTRYRSGEPESGPALCRAYLPVVRCLALAGTLDTAGATTVTERALAGLQSELAEIETPKAMMARAEEITRALAKEWALDRGGRPTHLVGMPAETAARAKGAEIDLALVFGDLPIGQAAWMLLEAVNSIPTHFEALFLLRHIEGMGIPAISDLAGVPTREVTTGVKAARRLYERELLFQMKKLATP